MSKCRVGGARAVAIAIVCGLGVGCAGIVDGVVAVPAVVAVAVEMRGQQGVSDVGGGGSRVVEVERLC